MSKIKTTDHTVLVTEMKIPEYTLNVIAVWAEKLDRVDTIRSIRAVYPFMSIPQASEIYYIVKEMKDECRR